MATPQQQHSIDILHRCLKLQAKDEKNLTRQARLDDLITDFAIDENTQAECAAGWCFCVPASFRAALDIKLTQRVVDDKKVMKWTQGPWFYFERGSTIFDSVNAYRPWDLNNFKICLDIRKATPATPATTHQSRQSGTVIFDVLKSDTKQNKLVNYQQVVMSQDEFVRLLIDGTGLQDMR